MNVFLTKNESIPMIFNVDVPVGLAGANKREDVFLVQFLLRKSAERNLSNYSEGTLARIAKVPLSGSCDDATIDAIKAVQEHMRRKNPGTVVDSRVSHARGAAYGAGTWTIVTLNGVVRDAFPEKWPRLQDFADCPDPLKARVKQVL